jgi:N-acylneuraminate cytidylyltransferase
MTIAIIPARGGSKRIPRKNIRLLNGKPAIAYAIDLARKSGIFDEVFVSTDDLEIARVSEEYGATIPFIRDTELSDDYATTKAVIVDAIERLSNKYAFGSVCCIYPVTPLLKVETIRKAVDLLAEARFVFAGIASPTPIEKGMRLDEYGFVRFLNDEYSNTRTQDLPKTYFDAGQFYFGDVEAWKSCEPVLGPQSKFIEVQRFEAVDIDEPEDWEFLELLLQLQQNKTYG